MEAGLTLVTGANGALGRLVHRELVAAHRPNLVVTSRTPERLIERSGVRRVRADFDDTSTLDAAFEGVRRALIISTDELTTPGRRQRQHEAALAAAQRQGVHHIAYTSMPSPEHSKVIPFAADHVVMETALRDSGFAYSILRNSWYQENLLSYLPQIVRDGTWFTSAGQGRIAYVARADAAAAAAKVVVGDRGHGIVDIAGPEALTVERMAQVVSEQLERPIRVEHVAPDELQSQFERQGISDMDTLMVTLTEANQLAGNFDLSSDATVALLGRPPRCFLAFVRRHAQTLTPRSPR